MSNKVDERAVDCPNPEALTAAIAELEHAGARRHRELAAAVELLQRAALDSTAQERLAPTLCALVDGDQPTDIAVRARRGSMGIGGAVAIGVLSLAAYLAAVVWHDAPFPWNAAIVGAIALYGTGLAVVSAVAAYRLLVFPWEARDRARLAPARIGAAALLSGSSSSEAVGALARAARSRRGALRGAAWSSLLQVLDRLRDGSGWVSARDQSDVLRLVSSATPRAQVVLLDRLGAIGGGAVVQGVRSIARSSEAPDEVRSAAEAALPRIEARAEAERSSRLLLRPSEADESAATLLRAAGSGEQGAQEQLLRAADDDHAAMEVREVTAGMDGISRG